MNKLNEAVVLFFLPAQLFFLHHLQLIGLFSPPAPPDLKGLDITKLLLSDSFSTSRVQHLEPGDRLAFISLRIKCCEASWSLALSPLHILKRVLDFIARIGLWTDSDYFPLRDWENILYYPFKNVENWVHFYFLGLQVMGNKCAEETVFLSSDSGPSSS